MGIRDNYEQGEGWEVRFEAKLRQYLSSNYDRQRLFGGRKPDFLLQDDDGQTEAFVEVKSGDRAGSHDMAQAGDHVENAAGGTSHRTTYFVTKPGFFTPDQKDQVLSRGTESDRVVFVEVPKPEDAAPHIVADLKLRQAEQAARRGSKASAQEPASLDVDGLPDAPEPPAPPASRPAPRTTAPQVRDSAADAASLDVDSLPREAPRTAPGPAPAPPPTPALPSIQPYKAPQPGPAMPRGPAPGPAAPRGPMTGPSSPFRGPAGRA